MNSDDTLVVKFTWTDEGLTDNFHDVDNFHGDVRVSDKGYQTFQRHLKTLEVEGVTGNTPFKEAEKMIKKKYKKTSRKLHPDMPGGDEEKFRELDETKLKLEKMLYLVPKNKAREFNRMVNKLKKTLYADGKFEELFQSGWRWYRVERLRELRTKNVWSKEINKMLFMETERGKPISPMPTVFEEDSLLRKLSKAEDRFRNPMLMEI